MGRVGQGSRDEHAKMSGVYIVGAVYKYNKQQP